MAIKTSFKGMKPPSVNKAKVLEIRKPKQGMKPPSVNKAKVLETKVPRQAAPKIRSVLPRKRRYA